MPISLLQTDEWGAFKSHFGWRPARVGGVLVLERDLPFGRRFLYVPEPIPAELTEEVLDGILHLGWERRAMVVKIEPLALSSNEGLQKTLQGRGFRRSFETLQPRHRQWIPLKDTAEQLLQQMKPKGRYNLRLAERHGVRVERLHSIDQYFTLTHATARRQRFTARSPEYFRELLKIPGVQLWGALYGNALVAGVIASFKPPYALYLYGASSYEHRHLMAPYLLHFHVMLEAERHNCETYDLLAISPPGEQRHRFQNLARFKEQFGGERVQLMGAWDMVRQPLWYNLYHLLEMIRRPGVE